MKRVYAAPKGSMADGYVVEVTQAQHKPTGLKTQAFLRGIRPIAVGIGQIYCNISNTVQPFYDRCRSLERRGWELVADESQPVGTGQKRFKVVLHCGDTTVTGETGFLTREYADMRGKVITKTLNKNLDDFDPSDELLSYTVEEYEE